MSDDEIRDKLAATFGHEPSEVWSNSGRTEQMACGNCFSPWPCATTRKIGRVMVPVVREAQLDALTQARSA